MAALISHTYFGPWRGGEWTISRAPLSRGGENQTSWLAFLLHWNNSVVVTVRTKVAAIFAQPPFAKRGALFMHKKVKTETLIRVHLNL